MEDARARQPLVGDRSHPRPEWAVLLAPSPQRAQPEFRHPITESADRWPVGRHSVVVEPAGDDLFQPPPLRRDRLVPTPSQGFLDRAQFGLHPVAPGPPPKLKAALARSSTDVSEPEKVERLRLAEASPSSVGRRMAAELDEARLVRMQHERDPRPQTRYASPSTATATQGPTGKDRCLASPHNKLDPNRSLPKPTQKKGLTHSIQRGATSAFRSLTTPKFAVCLPQLRKSG